MKNSADFEHPSFNEPPATPIIDSLLEDPADHLLDEYQAATDETALYRERFQDRESEIMPFLIDGARLESMESMATHHTYTLRMLGIVEELPAAHEQDMRKEVGDTLWFIAQMAHQGTYTLHQVARDQMQKHGTALSSEPLSLDTYQRFAVEHPRIGDRQSKHGYTVTTAENPLLTSSRMYFELEKAYGYYHSHPLTAEPQKVEPIEAIGAVLWWVAFIADTRFHMPLSEVANQNLAKLRSRLARGVLLDQSGDNR